MLSCHFLVNSQIKLNNVLSMEIKVVKNSLVVTSNVECYTDGEQNDIFSLYIVTCGVSCPAHVYCDMWGVMYCTCI